MPTAILIEAVVAGLLASVACGLGALPVFIPGLDPKKHIGLGYGVAGGLMFSASVYNLILPGLNIDGFAWRFGNVWPVLVGILAGAAFMSLTDRFLHDRGDAKLDEQFNQWGGRVGLLVFIAMTVHSIPEGVAVGTAYTAGEKAFGHEGLGATVALAIAIHNIPEGLAVAIPMRSAGASLGRCFGAAFFTSLPQPIAAIPAVLLAWFFEPLMPLLMGFAAGAMIFLVVLELLPEALQTQSHSHIAWAFTIGFGGMLLIQVVL